MTDFFCHACGAEVAGRERVGRRDTCRRCGADLHCCRQCAAFEPGAYNDCRELQAERVVDKASANFCDWFAPRVARPGAAPARGAAASPVSPPNARAELDRLFRRR